MKTAVDEVDHSSSEASLLPRWVRAEPQNDLRERLLRLRSLGVCIVALASVLAFVTATHRTSPAASAALGMSTSTRGLC